MSRRRTCSAAAGPAGSRGSTRLFGDWALRAHGGITGRANSAMAVGDPGRPLGPALASVREWYAERGLPALLQLPLTDPANQTMAQHGWVRLHVTVVQVAPIALTARLVHLAPRAVTGRSRRTRWMGWAPISLDQAWSWYAGMPTRTTMGELFAVGVPGERIGDRIARSAAHCLRAPTGDGGTSSA